MLFACTLFIPFKMCGRAPAVVFQDLPHFQGLPLQGKKNVKDVQEVLWCLPDTSPLLRCLSSIIHHLRMAWAWALPWLACARLAVVSWLFLALIKGLLAKAYELEARTSTLRTAARSGRRCWLRRIQAYNCNHSLEGDWDLKSG